MSVHLVANQHIVSKQGKPGGRSMISSEQIITSEEIRDLISRLHQEIHISDEAFIEIQRTHSQVLQIWSYRVVVVQAPLVKKTELTIVKSIMQRSLEEYTLDEQLSQHLLDTSKGILIAWAPWEGKSTFAQAFVQELAKKDIIIKTVESPRDLILDDHISQYSFSHAPHNEIRDILLLSRPDITVYDEVRNKEDFLLFKDLRLTGIGMIWVMHATHAIDAIQRMIGTIDLWLIPQIIDTVIFIQAWDVANIIKIEQTVKTPLGMNSEDLARPVILATDAATWDVLYELYSYGDSTVVMPVQELQSTQVEKPNAISKYATRWLQEYFWKELKQHVLVKIISPQRIAVYVPDQSIPRLIGKWWVRIQSYEKELWIGISVKSLQERWEGATWPPWAPKAWSWWEWSWYRLEEIKKWKKSVIQIDVWDEHAYKEMSTLIWWKVMNFIINHQWVVQIRRKKLVDEITRGEFELISIT